LSGKLATSLRATYNLQSAAGTLLFLLALALLILGLATGLLAVVRPAMGTWPWLLAFLVLEVPTVWAYWRSRRSARLIWVMGQWQPPDAVDVDAAGRPWLDAAALAFDQADFKRALQVMERLPAEAIRGKVKLAKGWTLLWNGRWDEGLGQLEDGGASRRQLKWLRSMGMEEVGSAQRSWPAWLTLILVVAAIAGLLLPLGGAIRSQAAALSRGFDIGGFEAGARGRFVVHYHDPAFAGTVIDLADDALDHDLAFMNLPGDTFKDREISLFLCEDQAEYMKRSPHPVPWEAACAVPDENAIFLYKPKPDPGDQIYFQVTVAHELNHLIYNRMGIHGHNDSWLNEGLANYVGYKYAFDRNNIPRQAWLQEHEFSNLRGHFIPFGQFFSIEPHQLSRDEDVGVFYEQGSSVVYLLIEEYGREGFLKFMKTYAEGSSVDRALAMTYPTLPNLEALAAVWGLFFNDAATVPNQASFSR
jgi:hypothetical protein